MKKFQISILVLTSALFLAGCQPVTPVEQGRVALENGAEKTVDVVNEAVSASSATDKTYTLAEVAAHAAKEDCWLVIEGKVYDVTAFVDQHPGGERILKGCGKDATEMFASIEGGKGHSQFAKTLLPDYYIGLLK